MQKGKKNIIKSQLSNKTRALILSTFMPRPLILFLCIGIWFFFGKKRHWSVFHSVRLPKDYISTREKETKKPPTVFFFLLYSRVSFSLSARKKKNLEKCFVCLWTMWPLWTRFCNLECMSTFGQHTHTGRARVRDVMYTPVWCRQKSTPPAIRFSSCAEMIRRFSFSRPHGRVLLLCGPCKTEDKGKRLLFSLSLCFLWQQVYGLWSYGGKGVDCGEIIRVFLPFWSDVFFFLGAIYFLCRFTLRDLFFLYLSPSMFRHTTGEHRTFKEKQESW